MFYMFGMVCNANNLGSVCFKNSLVSLNKEKQLNRWAEVSLLDEGKTVENIPHIDQLHPLQQRINILFHLL